jgi:predicted permease
MRALWRDAVYAIRALRKNPGFTLVAVLTLAVGIGATTIMFSAVDSILIEPYPYKDADRLTQLFIHDDTRPSELGRGGFSVPEFLNFRDQNHVFEDLMGYSGENVLYSTTEGTEQFNGVLVTGNTFTSLGVPTVAGRWIMPEDAKPDAPPVFVMNERLWAPRFSRDPKLLGTIFVLNGTPTQLVGIMPARFFTNGDIYQPLILTGSNTAPGGGPMYLGARGHLKKGVSLGAAAADLQVIAEQLSKIYTNDYPARFTVLPKNALDLELGDFRDMVYALAAAVLMLLLIACSNVANLLLARATVREKEIAVRASLGASRARLMKQLLVESFVLSGAGCALGCLLAYFGLRALIPMLPVGNGVPTNAVFGLNGRALLFAVGIAMLTALLCGLMPALHAARGELNSRLTGAGGGGKGASGGYRHGKLRAGLVIAEVAVSAPLLIGTGLMVRTLLAYEHTDLGFNPENILYARVAVPQGRYDTPDHNRIFFDQVIARIEALPGVVAATEAISLPPYGGPRSDITIPGKTHSERWLSELDWCGADYFRTLGIPLLRGRTFSEADIDSARLLVVINERLAHTYFKDEDPIGQTIKFNALDTTPNAPHDAYFEIIGVVRDARNQGLREPPVPEAFAPFTFRGASGSSIMVKTTADPLQMVTSMRKEVWAVDPNVALALTGTIESLLEKYSYSGPKFGLVMFGAFAGIGLVLVVAGVFGVMAYTVSLQTHEIGVRMAVGAQQRDIRSMVLKKGLLLTGTGVAIGVLASLGLTRFMASQIFGVSAVDPPIFVFVAAILVAVGLAACLLPARLAARVDPLVALRYE